MPAEKVYAWLKRTNTILFGSVFFLCAVIIGMLCSQFIGFYRWDRSAFIIMGLQYPVTQILVAPAFLSINTAASAVFAGLLLLGIRIRRVRYVAAVLPGLYWLFLVFIANNVPWD